MTTQTATRPRLRPPAGSSPLAAVGQSAVAAVDRARENARPLPRISPLLLQWFTWYSRRYIRRHFHSLRVSRAGLPPKARGWPLVIYSNHASWWDALVCVALKDEFFNGRSAFAPMDAAMLGRYKFFQRLGFFGVEQASRRGAAQFLAIAGAVLESSQNVLAITPQNRFVDVRERPVRFEAGLGHLATRVQRALFVPFAAEYVFWEERLPEILVRFGEPVDVRREHSEAFAPRYWTALFEGKLTETQDRLAAEAKRRAPDDFQLVMRGNAGQGGVYDMWRSLQAKLRGEKFNKEHGTK